MCRGDQEQPDERYSPWLHHFQAVPAIPGGARLKRQRLRLTLDCVARSSTACSGNPDQVSGGRIGMS